MLKRSLKITCLVLFIILLDQVSKYAIVHNFNLYDSIDIIPGFFSLTYVQNTGAGFSILEGKMVFFYLITLVAIAIFIYLLYKAKDKLEIFCVSLMLGGALGNFIDRLVNQYVIDFLDFNLLGYDFPIFNLADSFLCIGVFIYIVVYLLEIGGIKNGN